MTGPPKKTRPPGVAFPRALVASERKSDSDYNTPTVEISQDCLRRRPMLPGELPHVRQVFWNHAAQGTRLPAERGVILIDGGLA